MFIGGVCVCVCGCAGVPCVLIRSTSWKSTLLLAPVLTYYVLMRLRLVVEHDSETKRWAAFFPELPGCASAGDTEDEAIQNAKEALELWFERRRSICRPVQKSWKLRSRERALPCLHSPTRHSSLAQTWFCAGNQKGSHQKWRHLNGRQVIVALHGNKQIPIGTLKSIIKGAGLTAEDFR